MSGRYWDGCRAAPVRLIGWTCAKKAFGLAFAAHIPDERLAALAHVHVLNACAAHAPARRKWPCRCRAAEQRDELAAFCMTGKEHCEGRRGLGHDRTPVATGSPQAFRTLIRE